MHAFKFFKKDSSSEGVTFDSIFSYSMITIGAVLAAIALEIFLVPNLIIDGGLTGISIMLSKITNLKLGTFILVLNIPFLIFGYKQLGKSFLFKSSYGMILFSVLLEAFHDVHELTNDILLATAFGGLLLGIGVGLVIRYGGCLDGTEAIAILISKKTPLSVGQVILFFNIIIYGIASILFGWDRALYSLLTYFISFKLIDIVEDCLERTKSVLIITNHGDEIANDIYNRLGRTVTLLEGEGLVSGKKKILYSVITRMEIPELRRIVKSEDRSAFVAISDVSEIVGNHIKETKDLSNIDLK